MKTYIGTKVLEAEPMTRGEYNAHRGWAPPAGEDQSVAGYHVVYPDGYESWSPAAQFEAAYQTFEAMSFGHALARLQAGKRVARASWHGQYALELRGTAEQPELAFLNLVSGGVTPNWGLAAWGGEFFANDWQEVAS